jgi:hypothetical protein
MKLTKRDREILGDLLDNESFMIDADSKALKKLERNGMIVNSMLVSITDYGKRCLKIDTLRQKCDETLAEFIEYPGSVLYDNHQQALLAYQASVFSPN